MTGWTMFALIGALFGALAVSASRARVIALCRVFDGDVRVVRGVLPPEVLFEVREVVARAALSRATIELRREDGAVRVVLRDVTPEGRAAVEQRLRNAVGRFPIARFR